MVVEGIGIRGLFLVSRAPEAQVPEQGVPLYGSFQTSEALMSTPISRERSMRTNLEFLETA